ncbi:hypothetical protein, partial [Streptococcus pneumoniae]
YLLEYINWNYSFHSYLRNTKKGVDNLVSTPESLLKQKSCQRIFGRKPNQFISFYQSLIALKDW